jgi:hypothetical protein
MKKSEIYREAIVSILNDADMEDDVKVDVLEALFSDMSTAGYMDRVKEQENAVPEF